MNTGFKVEFVIEKETKGTVRYREELGDHDNPAIGTLYIKKGTLGQPPYPEFLTVEVTFGPSE